MQSSLKKLTLLAFILTGIFNSTHTRAAVITSNLSQPTLAFNNVSGSDDWVAQKFFNGSENMFLDGVRARMYFSGAEFVGILSDSADLPGTILGTFDVNPPLTIGGINDFPYTGPQMTLTAGTPYWIVVGAPTGLGSFQWAYTDGSSIGPGSIPQNWAYSSSYNSAWTGQAGLSYLLEVQGTPLPEPASLALVSGCALMSLQRRKR